MKGHCPLFLNLCTPHIHQNRFIMGFVREGHIMFCPVPQNAIGRVGFTHLASSVNFRFVVIRDRRRPDMTLTVDWALKTTYLSLYPRLNGVIYLFDTILIRLSAVS